MSANRCASETCDCKVLNSRSGTSSEDDLNRIASRPVAQNAGPSVRPDRHFSRSRKPLTKAFSQPRLLCALDVLAQTLHGRQDLSREIHLEI